MTYIPSSEYEDINLIPNHTTPAIVQGGQPLSPYSCDIERGNELTNQDKTTIPVPVGDADTIPSHYETVFTSKPVKKV